MTDPKTNRINIYRIKDANLSDDQLVKEYESYFDATEAVGVGNEDGHFDNLAYYITLPDVGRVYIRQAREKKTQWSSRFFLDKVQLYSKSFGAALIVRVSVDGRPETYVIAFGSIGRFIVDPEGYDDRFGIKTAFSAIDSESLKQIVKTEFTGSNRITQQQISNGSSMSGFEIDPFGDYLKSVTGDVEDSNLSRAPIKGSASLSVSQSVDISNIVDVLIEITKVYRSNAYKENYGWLDNLYMVSDSKTTNSLFEEAIKHMNEQDGTVWLAVPDLVDYDEVGYFRYLGDDHRDIELGEILESKGKSLGMEDLDIYISARSVEDDRTLKKWKLRKCVCGEVRLGGDLYGASDGKWFKIEENYAKRVEDEYEAIALYDHPFEAFSLKDDTKIVNGDGKEKTIFSEETYLRRVADTHPTEYVLLDQDLVKGIEVCDLITPDSLIHVKRYKGSSAMSHAFFQGLNSAAMLENDDDFLNEANSKIRANNPNMAFQVSNQKKKDVVFTVIGKGEEKRPHLPLFSKISLNHTIMRLRGLGHQAKLAAISISES